MSKYGSELRNLLLCIAAIIELHAVFVSGKVSLSVNKTTYVTVYGTPVTLECIVTLERTIETVHVYWTKVIDGYSTQMNAGYPGTDGMTKENPSLTIQFPTFADTGQYICAARAEFSNDTGQPINLNVIGGTPNATIHNTFYEVEYGQNITLECNVTSIPAHINVYWQKITNDTVTNITSDTSNIDGVTTIEPFLTILKATISDSGRYACHVENLIGTGQSDFSNLTVIGDIPSISIVGPTIKNVEYGSNVTLNCHVIAFPVQTHVYWQLISNGTTANITSDNSGIVGGSTLNPSLTILKARTTDSGLYTCYAINIVGTGHSDSVNLTIIGDIPTVRVGPTIKIAVYGRNVTLDCYVISFPVYTSVYWKRILNGTTANITSDNSSGIDGLTTSNPSMTILMARTADSGLYTCYVTNIVGTGHSDAINLTIIGDIPSVEVGPTIKIVEYGSNVTLHCNVTSFPVHTSVYWQIISNGKTTNITYDNAGIDSVSKLFPSLKILMARKADSGLYTCYAVNIVGMGRSKTINMTIIGGVPKVVIDEKSYNVEYGQMITLGCKVTSIPSYTYIYWQKKTKDTTINITSDSSNIKGVTITTPSMSILIALPADSGMYTCHAVNIAGTGHSGSVNLTVYGGIPQVTAESDSSDILYGHNHTIRCSITSVPVFTEIYWQKIFNGTTTNITSNSPGIDGVRKTRPSVTILKAAISDSGQYICFAVNIAGTGHSNSINLSVLGEENYPIVGIQLSRYIVKFGESLTIKSYVERNDEFPVLYIHWQYVNNGVLTTIGAGTSGIAGSTTDTPSLTIESVTTSESGLYTCFATNDVGTGKSKSINVTVVGGLPLVSVGGKKYISKYSHQITLTTVVKADPPVKFVYWEKVLDGRRTILNNGAVGTFGSSPNDPSLTLEYSTKADIGTYRCFATNDVGTGRSDIISLQVTGEKPTVIVQFNKISVNFGAKMNLSCNVDSTLPVTIVYWERIINGVISRINHGTVGTNGINTKNPSLTILHSTSADSGYYTCLAGNVVGISHSSSINVTVAGGMPIVSIGNLFYNTTYGKEIKLDCKITAYPPVTLVYWQKNIGDVITTLNEGTIGTKGITESMPSLVIIFPTTADSGNYTCFASNGAGTQKSMAAKLDVHGDIPVVTVRSPQYTAHYGDTVTLECDINAIPSPTRTFWHKTVNGIRREISNGYSGILGSTLKTPSLTIVFATTTDTGRYTCIAQNAAGIGQSQSTILEILADIPEVIVPTESYETGIGYSVTLICRIADASPAVSRVYWQRYKNNATTVITSDSIGVDGVTVDIPSLTISSVKESMSGEYTCFAINSVGTGSSFPTLLKVDAGITQSPSTSDSEDHTDTILQGVIGTVGALAAVIGAVIAYLALRKDNKDKAELVSSDSQELQEKPQVNRRKSTDIIATDSIKVKIINNKASQRRTDK